MLGSARADLVALELEHRFSAQRANRQDEVRAVIGLVVATVEEDVAQLADALLMRQHDCKAHLLGAFGYRPKAHRRCRERDGVASERSDGGRRCHLVAIQRRLLRQVASRRGLLFLVQLGAAVQRIGVGCDPLSDRIHLLGLTPTVGAPGGNIGGVQRDARELARFGVRTEVRQAVAKRVEVNKAIVKGAFVAVIMGLRDQGIEPSYLAIRDATLSCDAETFSIRRGQGIEHLGNADEVAAS